MPDRSLAPGKVPVSWHCIIEGSQSVVDADQEQMEGEASMLERDEEEESGEDLVSEVSVTIDPRTPTSKPNVVERMQNSPGSLFDFDDLDDVQDCGRDFDRYGGSKGTQWLKQRKYEKNSRSSKTSQW